MADSGQREGKAHDALEPLRRDPEYIRTIINRVLKLEQERLYQRQPHLNDDVIRIIKEEIKEEVK